MDIELLQKRKKQLGLTNQELSRISGVSLDTVSKILSGTAKSPEVNTIRALWEALDSFSIQSHPHHDADILRDGSQASLRGKEDGDYTLEDYYSLPADISAELIDGHLIFMEAPSILHLSMCVWIMMIRRFFSRILLSFATRKKIMANESTALLTL